MIIVKIYNDQEYHARDCFEDRTLCGIAEEGDDVFSLSLENAEFLEGKITCPDCIKIIKYCKSISSKDYI